MTTEQYINNRFERQRLTENGNDDIYASKDSIVESHILYAKLKCKEQADAIKKQLEIGLDTFGISLLDDFLLETTGNSLIDNAYNLDENIK